MDLEKHSPPASPMNYHVLSSLRCLPVRKTKQKNTTFRFSLMGLKWFSPCPNARASTLDFKMSGNAFSK
jgi:hypothetical protein